MPVRVVAHALGIDTPYPLPEPEACNALLNGQCPLEEGETAVYNLQMDVLDIFPQIPVGLTLTIYDEADEGIACFQVDCEVV